MILCLLPLTAQAVTAYPYGTLPTGAADADVTTAYNLWKTRRYVSASCGYRVDNGGGNTYSEGMGYGMLMAAYLETTDAMLGNLYTFYAANLDSKGIMNWSVGASSCSNNSANAATDGDLDAALALVMAAKKWPASANNWSTKATTLLNNIYLHEVDSCSGLANGDAWGGCTNGSPKNYNPSYFRTGYLKSFDCFEGGSRWAAVRTKSYALLAPTISGYKLPPDWVTATGSYGASDASGGYGYDSCRTPWVVGMDYLWWGNTTAQTLDNQVTASFAAQGSAASIGDDYNYSTGAKDSSNHEPEFFGAVGVASMVGSNNTFRDALYTELKTVDKNTYFSDSLRVIYLMAMTGNFQEPCNGGGSPGTPTRTPTVTPTPSNSPTPTPAFSLAKSASLSTAAVGQTFTYYLSYANLSTGPDTSGVTSGVSLQFHDNNAGTSGSNLSTNFQIVNNSGASISLANYRIRYFYYDTANATPASYAWSSYYDQAGTSSASFLAYGPYTGPPSANLELRIGFSGGSVANAATNQLQGAFNYTGNPTLSFSDDWSYPGAVGSFSTAAAANIVLEQNVAGVWKPVSGAYPGGAASISNVTITDALDSRLTFISSSPAGTYAASTLSVTFATLAPGQAGNVTVLAAVNGTASAGNVIPNQATIASSGFPSAQSSVVNVTVGSAATATVTPTRTASPSPTRTASPSPTLSPGNTATASPSASPTPSSSVTRTVSPSASPSVSPGSSATFTPTVTPTASHSPISTATATATVSATSSGTGTRTASPSASPTSTASMTATPTASATGTGTPSGTLTASASATPTRSPSPTVTPSGTFSVSPTDTPYAGSPTDTFTASPSPTMSVSATVTPTRTASASPSASPTSTASVTPTQTPSATASVMPSATATPTGTPSPSATASFTASPALTATPSATITATATVTRTWSATASSTPSATPTPSFTPQPTPVPGSPTTSPTPVVTAAGQGPLEIGRHAALPSPWRGTGPARLALEMKGACDTLTVKLYTPAMACVGQAQLDSLARGWDQVTLPAKLVQTLPSGVYYYSLCAQRNAGVRSKTVLGVWMVLR